MRKLLSLIIVNFFIYIIFRLISIFENIEILKKLICHSNIAIVP